VIYPGSTPVGNATLVVANVLTCNKHSQKVLFLDTSYMHCCQVHTMLIASSHSTVGPSNNLAAAQAKLQHPNYDTPRLPLSPDGLYQQDAHQQVHA
jgi:hypothetical protein